MTTKNKHMRTHIFVACFFLSMLHIVAGQKESLKVITDKDTLQAGEMLTYEVILENIPGKIQLPSFAGFNIVGGPNSQSSYSFINGVVKQSESYKVFLSPVKTGELSIDAPVVKSEKGDFEGQRVHVYVKEEGDSRDQGTTEKPVLIEAEEVRPKTAKRILKKI